MKKFILYFFLLLFLVGIGTFIFGFWNAKAIRNFSQDAWGLKVKYNFEAQMQQIERSFSSGGKDVSKMREDSKNFAAQLEEISQKSQSAGKEVQNLNAPGIAGNPRDLLVEYYSKVSSQAKDLKNLSQFIGENYEVAAVFAEINENTSLDEMENLIDRAKEKTAAIAPEKVPQSLQGNAKSLKEAIEAFLVKMEEAVSGVSSDPEQLNGAYAEFSQKEDEFSKASKEYMNSLPDMSLLEKQIDEELLKLNGIYFRIR